MNHSNQGMTIRSMLVPLALAVAMLAWGLMIFWLVGDRKPMPWYYGAQSDVPGQSPYATERIKPFSGAATAPLIPQVQPQHVDGASGADTPAQDSEEDRDDES